MVRFKRVVYQRLQSAFSIWRLLVRGSSSRSMEFRDDTEGKRMMLPQCNSLVRVEWKSQVAQSRILSIAQAVPNRKLTGTGLLELTESPPPKSARSNHSVMWSPQLESFYEQSPLPSQRRASNASPTLSSRSVSPISRSMKTRSDSEDSHSDFSSSMNSAPSTPLTKSTASISTSPPASIASTPIDSPSRQPRHTPIRLSSAARRNDLSPGNRASQGSGMISSGINQHSSSRVQSHSPDPLEYSPASSKSSPTRSPATQRHSASRRLILADSRASTGPMESSYISSSSNSSRMVSRKQLSTVDSVSTLHSVGSYSKGDMNVDELYADDEFEDEE